MGSSLSSKPQNCHLIHKRRPFRKWSFLPTDDNKTMKIIYEMKNKSCGFDWISNEILKWYSAVFEAPILDPVNKCIDEIFLKNVSK